MPRRPRRSAPIGGRRRAQLGIAAVVAAVTTTFGLTNAAAQEAPGDEADPVAVAQRAGEAWLAGVQQPDGGYALAGLAGVETPEAVLALAVQAQTSDVWNDREAIDGVEALGARDGGASVSDALSTLARSTTSAADAALLITRVALPLGLDPTSFDPANQDGPVDLVALLGRTDATASVAARAEIVMAQVALREAAPEDQVTAIVNARLEDGSWAASGGTETDVVTTASAVGALIAAGIPPDDERVLPGLRMLAAAQHDDGGWGASGTSRPADTAAAMGALRAAGFDPNDVCWQEDLLGSEVDRPTPAAHLVETQAPDGYWGDGGEALSTAVVLQAFDGLWLPLVRGESRTCGGGLVWPLPTMPPAMLAIAGVGVVGTFGAVRILWGDDADL